MKNCIHCKHADWNRTASGALHPSGDGRCQYPWKLPPLPSCMYWIGGTPSPYGCHINRKKDQKEHCVYYARKD